ncbi:hypothetical protein AQB9606_04651 [Aquabacterium sp. CECT 9606]|nr:hypothetical protein AQB9606_04651 [Aquabacterium sp. CECT 9606]
MGLVKVGVAVMYIVRVTLVMTEPCGIWLVPAPMMSSNFTSVWKAFWVVERPELRVVLALLSVPGLS